MYIYLIYEERDGDREMDRERESKRERAIAIYMQREIPGPTTGR